MKKEKLNWLFFGWLGVEDKAIPWNEIFAWVAMQGERQQNLGVDKNFVKRTNQWEFVRLWLMLQSEAKKKENLQCA